MNEELKRTKSLDPDIRPDSVVLILGTLPGQASAEQKQYYSDPTNKFWGILAGACEEPLPKTVAEKAALLQKYKIALWDVVESAVRKTSNDKDLKNEEKNKLPELLATYPNIKLLLFHSNGAYKYFRRFFKNSTIPYIRVSSPSGQNRKNMNEKVLEWKAALSSVLPQLQMAHRLEEKS
ncbi:MAG: DNA-deoxyinosine glycosylase [Oscillospiraceae bacterium]|jgi:hypoxanthine-DNA glycosylase|nr:DNA-deoxyinosine glycosylase [Oscillospiraceae bacterium]